MIYFLQGIRCYLEGSEFEMLNDNQVLESFFMKPNHRVDPRQSHGSCIGRLFPRAAQLTGPDYQTNSTIVHRILIEYPPGMTSHYNTDPVI